MKYEQLEQKNLSSMTRKELEKWVEDLYSKAKQIQYSEKINEADSVFWKQELSKKVSQEEMENLYLSCDHNRKIHLNIYFKEHERN